MRGYLKYILLFIIAFSSFGTIASNPKEIDLSGTWLFRVGDRMEWATTAYDDSDWDKIKVPANWENEGFQGYDGYAWYRLRIEVPENFKNQELSLYLGYIDDVDEVYINGVKIGQTGSFPPMFHTAYNAKRAYCLSEQNIRFGEENLIAIRVYDTQLSGGLVSGIFKLVAKGEKPLLSINLEGEWLFNKGKWIDAEESKPIWVPGLWENQGYYKYDGYGVYHKRVFISEELAKEQLIMMIGKIDDVDQLYVNGEFVGETGNYRNKYGESMYLEERNYVIPKKYIKAGQDNLIEIRVHDFRYAGGVITGPVGIITQDKFREYWKSRRKY